jgi:outer membrane protein TolC
MFTSRRATMRPLPCLAATVLAIALAVVPVVAQSPPTVVAGAPTAALGPRLDTNAASAGGASAASQPTAAAFLDQLVRDAIARNLMLAQRDLSARQAGSAVRQARGVLLPTLAVDARYSEFSGVVNIGDFINPAYAALNQLIGQDAFPTNVSATLPFRQDTRLRSTQLLYNPAAIAQWRLARTLHGVAESQRQQAARELAADVQLAWLGYAGATRVVDVYTAALEVTTENVRVAERLVANDLGTVDAVHRARADQADVAQQLADAERQRDAARRVLNLMLDRELDTPVPVLDDSTLVAPIPEAVEPLARAALGRREELQQAALGLEAAARQRRLADGTFHPTLAFAAEWGIQGDRYRFDGSGNVALASVVLQWNLLNGGQDAARREQATLEQRKAALRQRDAERQVMLHVEQAWDAAQVARTALTTSATRLEAASRAFTLVARRYDEGLAPHVEFVAARAAYTQAELGAVLARFTYAARRVDLERAAALRALTP